MKVSGKKELNIVLKEDTETLDEVVVVGFGTQKKVNLTGAVMQKKIKYNKSVPVSNYKQGKEGRALCESVMIIFTLGQPPSVCVGGAVLVREVTVSPYEVDGF